MARAAAFHFSCVVRERGRHVIMVNILTVKNCGLNLLTLFSTRIDF